jgi:hypothetical protein
MILRMQNSQATYGPSYGPDTALALDTINTWVRLGDVHMYLRLSHMNLTSLPPIPPTVQRLTLGHLKIKHITTLPPNLLSFEIHDTPIETICRIPDTVEALFINFTNLKELPGPLPPNLCTLYCLGSKIKKLPPFPSELVAISIQKNPNLHEIPPLPTKKLSWIQLSDTPIRVLSVPDSVTSVYDMHCPNLLIHTIQNETMDSYRARWFEVMDTRRGVPRMRLIKEELVSVMWHPRRVWSWLKAGRLIGYINGEPEHDHSVLDMMAGLD